MITYRISIPEPCNENWDQMTPKKNGRHCSSCNKVVVDFTNMSEKEIVAFLLKNKSACGRISAKILNKPIAYFKPVKHIKYQWPAIAAFIVAGMFSVMPSFSQTPIQKKVYNRNLAIPKHPDIKSTSNTHKVDSISSAKKLLSQLESHFILAGRVITKQFLNEEKQELIGVSTAKITISRGERKLIEIDSDDQGNFEAKIDRKYLNKWLNFKVEANGMEENVEYHKFGKMENAQDSLQIEMQRIHYFMGAYVVIQKNEQMMPGTIGSRIDLDYFASYYFAR
jgi:hypothetical protein